MELSRLFFEQLGETPMISELALETNNKPVSPQKEVYQCGDCLTIYEEQYGNPAQSIPPNTSFEDLPVDYVCSVCEGAKENFQKIALSGDILPTV